MAKVNPNYQKLPGSYLFSEIARRTAAYSEAHPEAKLIKMGIGDVTRPLAPAVIEAMHAAVEDMAKAETFHGYGPEQGYDFLRSAIAKRDFHARGVDIADDEIFISDGAKSDCGNIGDILDVDNVVAVCDPVYPVYVDSNAMAGRAGDYDEAAERWTSITYMPTTAENGFCPALPEGKVDVIIYMTKATQLEQAIQDSMPVVGDTTVAVSLINGLGNDDNLFKVFPKERCIIGSGVLGTALPEPAHCVSTPAGGVQMNFGGAVRSELTDAACAEMLKCYRAGGCDAYWRDGEPGTDNNIYKFIWKKVCVNATVNTVCAVLRLKIGEVEADPFGQWLFHSVIRETCAVATAKGVPMDADEFIAHDHKDIVTNIADYYPSMCQDMLFNHRQTEIDVLNGKIAEYGEQLGIDTPVCKVLSQVVRCIQGNYDKQYLK